MGMPIYTPLTKNDDPVFNEMVNNYKTVNSINKYYLVTPCLTLAITKTKVLKKHLKTRFRTQLATIKQAQSHTIASTRFLSTSLRSVSEAITHANTDKIALYNNTQPAVKTQDH